MPRKKRSQKKSSFDLCWKGHCLRGMRYVSFVALFVVFFVVMFSILPHETIPESLVDTPSNLLTGNVAADTDDSSLLDFTMPLVVQFALFSVLVGGVIALLLYVDQGPPKERVRRKKRKLEHLMKRKAYAIRSRNKPEAQRLYGKIHKVYHQIEPHSHDYNQAIHSLHKEMNKLK